MVLWSDNSYLKEPQPEVLYEIVCEKSKENLAEGERRLIQTDGYTVLTTKKWRNQFKRDGFLHVRSPGECTDLNTSVVDAHIGKEVKDRIRENINKVREHDLQ